VADSDLLRARWWNSPRRAVHSRRSPAGVGGPLSPLVTNPASASSVTPGTAVATNPLELGVLGEVQTNLSVQGTIPQSIGTPVTIFDPAVVGLLNWTHQTTPQTNTVVTGTPSLISNITTANASFQEGFSSGTQVNLSFNNNHDSLNSLRNIYNPFTGRAWVYGHATPAQRVRASLNRRFIKSRRTIRKLPACSSSNSSLPPCMASSASTPIWWRSMKT
jgi:hypothetical protein